MAFQLIYTSAPRLLQAGRTGFGTVAMHPGIPSWLQGEIERDSQFSRVPGLDPARVILRHMIFGQGDRVHHVLSRIQDSGADYTGRTNHIAHHFIFTAAEAAQATSQGVTTVDAFAFLESHALWRSSWSEEPTHLSDNEIIPVASIPKTIILPAAKYWGTLIPSRPESAAILAPGKTAEACWIVYPPEWRDCIIYLMGESLVLHKNPWGISFSNDLQPTDNEQLIAWRGIPSYSPLLPKAASSVRPSLDLTNPDALTIKPVPEFINEARTGEKNIQRSFSNNNLIPLPTLRSEVTQEKKPVADFIPQLSKINTAETQKKNHAAPLTILLGVLLIILGFGGAIYSYNIYSENKLDKERLTAIKEKISQQIQIASQNQNAPDLSEMENINELQCLLNFLGLLNENELKNAEKSLNELRNFSGEWNEWRVFCNKLQERKKEEEDNKTLLTLFKKQANGENFNSENFAQITALIKQYHSSEDNWMNALAALDFLRDPMPENFSNWVKPPQLPNYPESSQILEQVRQKIDQIKVATFNQDLAKIEDKVIFDKKLTDLLIDWPTGSKQQKFLTEFYQPSVLTDPNGKTSKSPEQFTNLELEYPVSLKKETLMDSKVALNIVLDKNNKQLNTIYITSDQATRDAFKPTGKQKFKKLKAEGSISWNQLESQNMWDIARSANQFTNDDLNYNFYVYEENESKKEIKKAFVLKNDLFTQKIINYNELCIISPNQIVLRNNFSDFLNRLYQDENNRFVISWSLDYHHDFYKKNDISRNTLNFEAPEPKLNLLDSRELVKQFESIVFENKSKVDKLKSDLMNDLKSKESELNRLYPVGISIWSEFHSDVEKALNKEKEEFKNLKEIFLNTKSRESPSGFCEMFSKSKKQKDITSEFKKLPPEIKKFFFFNGQEWDDESRGNFIEQFEQKKKLTFESEIQNLKTQIQKRDNNQINKSNQETLKKLQADQKANLKFYLNDTLFLTTEVTIPFNQRDSSHNPSFNSSSSLP